MGVASTMKTMIYQYTQSVAYRIANNSANCKLAVIKNDADKWHRRLGHIDYTDIQRMVKGVVDGMNIQGEIKKKKD